MANFEPKVKKISGGAEHSASWWKQGGDTPSKPPNFLVRKKVTGCSADAAGARNMP